MNQEVTKMIWLFTKLLVKPIKTLKENDLVPYSKRNVAYKLLLFAVMFVSIAGYINRIGSISIGYLICFILIKMIFCFLAIKIFVLFYNIIFKLGTNIKLTYEDTENLLLPYVFLMLMIEGIYIILSNYIFYLNDIVDVSMIMNIWICTQVFLLTKFKLKQSNIRSLIIACIGLFLLFAINFAYLQNRTYKGIY